VPLGGIPDYAALHPRDENCAPVIAVKNIVHNRRPLRELRLLLLSGAG